MNNKMKLKLKNKNEKLKVGKRIGFDRILFYSSFLYFIKRFNFSGLFLQAA